jgi:ribonuclease J
MVLPVHGEIRHMQEQARFALQCGVPHALTQKNGDLVRLSTKGGEIIDRVRSGRLILDGDVILPADGESIGERRKLALHGHISVAITMKKGRSMGTRIQYRGVPVEDDRDQFLEDLNEAAEVAADKPARDMEARKEAIRLGVRRVATHWTGKKPVTDVLIVEV